MILGRPANLWLGLNVAIVGAIQVTLVAFGFAGDVVATVGGAWGAVSGAIILIVANQPPTVKPGDTVTLQTPDGAPNQTVVIAPPPPVVVDASNR